MLFKVIGVGLSAVIINVILKQYKPEFCVVSNVCAGFIIFMLVANSISDFVEKIIDVQNLTGINSGVVSPILKVIGVGYIVEFASNIAEESGNKSVASKILLGGKIAICGVALPILETLINAILSLI